MKNTNKFAQTLNAEQAAREAQEAATANKAEVETIIARENAHADEPTFGIFETIKLFQEGKRISVKLQVLEREPVEGEDLSDIEVIDMPVGCATSKEDVVAMIEDLRPYAPKGRLLTRSDVIRAMGARTHADMTAGEAVEAGINPDRKIVVDGQEFLICGTQIRNPENGEVIIELKSLPRLVEEDFNELVAPAVREALAAKHPAPINDKAETTELPEEVTITLDDLGLEFFEDDDEMYDLIHDYLLDEYGAEPEDFEWETGDKIDEIVIWSICW